MCIAENKAQGKMGARGSLMENRSFGAEFKIYLKKNTRTPSSCREASPDSIRDQVLLCVVLDLFIT